MFKKLVTNLFDFNDRLSDVKDTRAFNRCATTADARAWFGFKPGERFTFDDLQLICADWKRRNAGGSEDKEGSRYMARAYQLLAAEARGTTLEQRTEEDTQYRREAHTLWKSMEPHFTEMDYDEACPLFASQCEISPDTVKDLFPVELTALFGDHRERALTVETARQFDEAYRRIFITNYNRMNNGNYAWAMYIAQPYSPVLAKKLGLPLSVVEIEPVIAETPEEDAIEAPTLSDESISLKMTVEEARVFLEFGKNETVTLETLYTRYKNATAANDSKAIQEEIDTAYQVLIAHLKKEVAYQQERARFGYGLMETFTEEDLRDRYELASENTDSKAEQKLLDEAYQVLLKIAV